MMFHLTTKRLEKSCLILQDELYTVYKITIRKTGQYYIGVTQDLQKRIDNHGATILYLLGNSEYENGVLQFHREAVKVIDGYGNYFETERKIRAALDVQVLGVVHGKKYGYLLESFMISDCVLDNLCLNIQ